MRTLRLVVDINRTACGHIEGRIQAPGEPAVPFSGRLELLRAIEDALPVAEQAARTPRAPRVIGSTNQIHPPSGWTSQSR